VSILRYMSTLYVCMKVCMSHVNVSVWRYMSMWICLSGVTNESCECVYVEVYVYVDMYM